MTKTDIPDTFTLSVVVPVYNEERTLAKLVDAVRAVPIRKQIVLVEDAWHVSPLVGVVVAAMEEEGEPGIEGCVHGAQYSRSRPTPQREPDDRAGPHPPLRLGADPW